MIKLFIMDVDGTLTDGKIYLGNNGEEFKAFNVKDGLGIKKLFEVGITPIIITGRNSRITETRCKELGIKHLFQNVVNKKIILNKISNQFCVDFSQMAYIGDDINDLECITSCGLSACPNDSFSKVVANVNYVCNNKGGAGCVREFIEYVIECNNKEIENENSCNNANKVE